MGLSSWQYGLGTPSPFDKDHYITSHPKMSEDEFRSLSHTPSNEFHESNSGLTIPEPRDGFYGYTDEKSLQQVRQRFPLITNEVNSYRLEYG